MIQVFDQEIPNKMSELTIEQFEKISQILNNQDFDNIERYVEMFKYLGIKEELWDDYPFSKFVELIKEFNLNSFTPSETVTSIEVDGYTYEAQLKLTCRTPSTSPMPISSTRQSYSALRRLSCVCLTLYL